MTPAQAAQFERLRELGRQAHAAAAAGRIEDYLFVTDGDPYRLSLRQAADRLGVTPRTVQRWRARLRQHTTQGEGTPDWDGAPAGEVRREMAESMGLNPWTGAA